MICVHIVTKATPVKLSAISVTELGGTDFYCTTSVESSDIHFCVPCDTMVHGSSFLLSPKDSTLYSIRSVQVWLDTLHPHQG